MFGFNRPEDGSQERFRERVSKFEALHRSTAIHHFWWLVHNIVAHPFIGIAPVKAAFDFHDWTSRKINAEPANPVAEHTIERSHRDPGGAHGG